MERRSLTETEGCENSISPGKKVEAGGTQSEFSVRQPFGGIGNQAAGRLLTGSDRSDRLTLRHLASLLQRTHGNRFVSRFLQAKFEVSQPGDPYEREADQVAEHITGSPMPQRTGAALSAQEDVISPHAESAVAAAANSAAEPLPPTLRRKFEHALGTDLSSVRVHTGTESIAASRAISAHAYTVGDHIHFNRGQYDPESMEGQRLLAHEVAHTVQQGGDAHRLSKFWDSAALIPVRQVVQRDKATDLEEMAEAGGSQATSVDLPPAGLVSNIHDVQAAQALAAKIEGFRGNMQEGSKAGGAFTVSPLRVTPEKIAANEQAISTLDDYLVTAGEQSRTTGSFQDGLQKARTDYARLQAQVTHLTVTNVIAGGTAGDIGEQIVKGAGFADADAAQARMKQAENKNSGLAALHNQVQDAHDQMIADGQLVGSTQKTVTQSAYAYMAALNSFKTGVPTVNDNPEQAKQLSDLKEKIESVKKYVGKGLEYAGKAAGKAGIPGAESAGEHAGPVVDWLTDQFYDAQLNAIQTTIAQYNAAHGEHAITSALDTVRSASAAFTKAITDFQEKVDKFGKSQITFREKIRQLGRTTDAGGGGGGNRYAQIASVLAEVDTYETQLDDTLRLAYQEQTAAREASGARHTVEGGVYYEPYKTYHFNGGWGYQCYRNELRINSAVVRGTAEGPENIGVNATVNRAVADLQELRKEVDPMRKALAQAMNLNMGDPMPLATGSPAPTPRSDKTGL